MNIKKTALVLGTSAIAMIFGGMPAHAADGPIRIGFVTDMSGGYADMDGQGGVEAIKMAIADAGGSVGGRKIELLVADHQNKADIAANRAREWYDSGVDVVIGGTNSSANLAIAKIAVEKKKVFLSVGSGTTRLTNEECNPYTVQYVYDTYSIARSTAKTIVKQGGKNWYLVSADLAFGHSLEKDSMATVTANGGTVVGSIRHPLNASDFSSFVLQAQSSRAQVLGLGTSGMDLVNAIKSVNEYALIKKMKVAAPLFMITDIHALGLAQTSGMYFTDGWYWNQDADSRKWAKRFYERRKAMPSMLQAGDASATLHYLNAVKVVGTDAAKVMAQMKSTKINDFFAKGGVIRPDGRMVHDMYLMQVKSEAESKSPWDYAKLVETIPGDQAYTPKADSKCALWK